VVPMGSVHALLRQSEFVEQGDPLGSKFTQAPPLHDWELLQQLEPQGVVPLAQLHTPVPLSQVFPGGQLPHPTGLPQPLLTVPH
jgi:hypothetical protein